MQIPTHAHIRIINLIEASYRKIHSMGTRFAQKCIFVCLPLPFMAAVFSGAHSELHKWKILGMISADNIHNTVASG